MLNLFLAIVSVRLGIFLNSALHTTADLVEAVDFATADCAVEAVAEALILMLKGAEELFHFLTLGMLICGAFCFNNGEVISIYKIHNVSLGHIEKGANES